jgi:pre-mRNA-splicing factor ISY1
MARPSEMAQNMMNKWVRMREEGNAAPHARGKRPRLASECDNLSDAEYYRSKIMKEILACVSKIQNPALGEHTIRDLNDDINKKMREKFHWNKRIKQLGGIDYNKVERERQIQEGDTQSLEGPQGYRYFGVAKDLPGVKELFEKQAKKAQSRKRGEIVKHLTSSYYGWRDEEDGVLLELEGAAFQKNKRMKLSEGGDEDEEKDAISDYLDVPSQEEITKVLLQEKKKALLSKFSF